MAGSTADTKPEVPEKHASISEPVTDNEVANVDAPKEGNQSAPRSSGPRSSTGWDGKLRVGKKAVLANPEALSDPEYSDDDAPPPEQIAADEDLLEDYPEDEEEIELVHRGISSIPALKLERFKQIRQLGLRQNQISNIELPENLGFSLKELELSDNLISHIRGLEFFHNLTSLDLSYNKIKHVKNIDHLRNLTHLYFAQNKISSIENVATFTKLRNLELGGNRIREIENLDTLRTLEELWLGKNKITELKNLSALSNLKIIDVRSNRLTSLDGLQDLFNLEELYVSHNALEIIGQDLQHNTKLRVIDITANRLTKLDGVKHLSDLEEFWASENELSSFQEVEDQLRNTEKLETVYLEGNPLQRQNGVTYRNKVRLALPQVKQIDATFVQVS